MTIGPSCTMLTQPGWSGWRVRTLDSNRNPWDLLEGNRMAQIGKLSIVGELWSFMKVRKKWWLGPIMLVLVLFGVLLVATQGSALAPFIYTIF